MSMGFLNSRHFSTCPATTMFPTLNHPLKLDLSRPLSILWSTANFYPARKPLVILDSSFNPPSRAHASLCLSSLSAFPASQPSSQVLLLLSTKNADKLVEGHSNLDSRIKMMQAMAQDLVEARSGDLDVAVALIAEPFFAQKNVVLKETWPTSTLSWIIGWE